MQEKFKYNNCLVTGCAGFIGSHISEELLKLKFKVIGIDNLYTGSLNNISSFSLNNRFEFKNIDIRNKDLLFNIENPIDIIFHQAAMVNVLESVKNPQLCYEINVNGTINILELARKKDVERIIFASSAAVYGNDPNLPKTENMIPSPSSPYGISKLECEKKIKEFSINYGIKSIILRYFNVYGPRQGSSPYSGVISLFITRILKDQDLIIYGDGYQTRDFIYVKDVVKANILSSTFNFQKELSETFNVATGNPIDLNSLVNIIIKLTNKNNIKIIYKEEREGDIKHSFADINKIKNKLKFNPNYSLETGLNELILYFSNKI